MEKSDERPMRMQDWTRHARAVATLTDNDLAEQDSNDPDVQVERATRSFLRSECYSTEEAMARIWSLASYVLSGRRALALEIEVHNDLVNRVERLKAELDRRDNMLYDAWNVIANSGAFGGPPSEGLKEAATRWRDEWHALVATMQPQPEGQP